LRLGNNCFWPSSCSQLSQRFHSKQRGTIFLLRLKIISQHV
jgi:hypothetical protein